MEPHGPGIRSTWFLCPQRHLDKCQTVLLHIGNVLESLHCLPQSVPSAGECSLWPLCAISVHTVGLPIECHLYSAVDLFAFYAGQIIDNCVLIHHTAHVFVELISCITYE